MAEKVAEAEPASTVIEDGTVSWTLLLATATVVPPGGAAWLRLTVHTVVAPALMILGLQASADGTTTPASKLITNCRDAPLKVAVNVATCNWLIRPAVRANVAEVVFAGTITKGAGTGSRPLLLAKLTTVPPFGAAWFSVTLQVVDNPEFTLVGLQTNDDNVTGAVTVAARLTVAD
jgi:hypothetical protein